jgi:hypothetical protein
MDEDTKGYIAGLICCGLLIGLFVGGCYMGVQAEREAAIEAKCAHYEIDPVTGESRFVYGPGPGKAPQSVEK